MERAGDLLAVVTGGWVRVYESDWDLRWEQRGEFYGNPRWSPNGEHLFVDAMPPSGGDVAYMFTAEGERLWRFRSEDPRGYGYACLGDVWIDDTHIGIGDATVSIGGQVTAPIPAALDASWSDLGIELAAGVGITNVRITDQEYRMRLTDGRYVFQSWPFEVGRGGCAKGVTVDLTGPAGLEFPPFYDDNLLPGATAPPTSP